MRLNLDGVTHPIHCYYPASGKRYFDRLRYSTIYRERIHVIEHPVSEEGIVHDDGKFRIEAAFLKHGVPNLGWRVTESSQRKFDPEQLKALGVHGPMVRELKEKGHIEVAGKKIVLDDVSHVRDGESMAVVIDTLPCDNAVKLAKNARMLLCESTYLSEHAHLAKEYNHMTATQAAEIAREANVEELILTHYSARYRDLAPFVEEAQRTFQNTKVADDLKRFNFPKKK